MHLPVIETGALPWKGSMLPLHQRCLWRTGASIPLPLACKASALPFELVPPTKPARRIELLTL